MSTDWGCVEAGVTLPFFFYTYNAAGASVTMTNFLVTDIEVYKGTSMTNRASDNGYTLLDTDGIDIDGVTGMHGFSIDLSDNSDASFYAAGSFYNVMVSVVTIDSQTVTLKAGTFRIGPMSVNVTQNAGTAITSASGRQEVNVSHIAGSAVSTSTAQIGVNVIQAAGTAWGSGAITAASIATDAITAAKIAADAIGASELAADAVTEIQAAVAAGAVASVTGAVGSVTGNVGGNVAGSVASVTGNVGGNVTGSVGSLAAQAKADVNAEVVDVMAVDTHAEQSQGTPPAAPTYLQIFSWLYMALRNKSDTTATLFQLYGDDGSTVVCKAVVSNDGVTLSRAELVTGP